MWPFAAKTAAIRRGIDSINEEQNSGVIHRHHTFMTALFRSAADDGFKRDTSFFTFVQQFSIGLRSGDNTGQQQLSDQGRCSR